MFDFIYLTIGFFVAGYVHKQMIQDQIHDIQDGESDLIEMILVGLVIVCTVSCWPFALAFYKGFRRE